MDSFPRFDVCGGQARLGNATAETPIDDDGLPASRANLYHLALIDCPLMLATACLTFVQSSLTEH